MKHYFNKEAFIEGLSCLLFAFTILYLIFTEKYLLFIRPGMKIYLYFTAIVMIIWSVSCFRRIAVPQYKMHLNRFLVIVVPMIAMFLPYTVIKASETAITSQMQTSQTDIQQNTSSQNKTAGSNNSNQKAAASKNQENNQQNNQQNKQDGR